MYSRPGKSWLLQEDCREPDEDEDRHDSNEQSERVSPDDDRPFRGREPYPCHEQREADRNEELRRSNEREEWHDGPGGRRQGDQRPREEWPCSDTSRIPGHQGISVMKGQARNKHVSEDLDECLKRGRRYARI